MDLHTDESIRINDRSRQADYRSELAHDVRVGFARRPKELSPKYFYDEQGSKLFEKITTLPEYYQTRTERSMLESLAPRLADDFEFSEMIEFGSGNSEKTRVLLDRLSTDGALRRYIPIDVSREFLADTAERLHTEYPSLMIEAVVGDFNDGLDGIDRNGPGLILFLGGTLGNFYRADAVAFLSRVAGGMRPDDSLLLGIDLVKDPELLHAAYNDAQGVTAAFNRNVFHVINAQLGGHFDPDTFWHYACYNPDDTRIEMRLISRKEQTVRIDDLDLNVSFEQGESVLTEISRKFTQASIRELFADAGMELQHWWTDPESLFGLCLGKRASR